MFGLGQAVTRCTKSYSTTPVPLVVKWNPLRTPRLVWVSHKYDLNHNRDTYLPTIQGIQEYRH